MLVDENKMDEYIKVPIDENEKKSVIPDLPASYGYGVRHIQLVIFFICISTSFVARGHLGVTLVAMTSSHNIKYTHNATVVNGTVVGNVDAVNLSESNFSTGRIDENVEWTIYRTYTWPKSIQEPVLASFFLGYCLMMFPLALICQRWGGKVPLQVSLLVNGLVSLFTPWITLWGGWKAMCACRIVQGLSQAGTYPGLQTLLAKWVPLNERATLTGYVYTGSTVGTVIGFQLSGILAESALGWPSTFWAVGVMCLLCFLFLTIFGASTPLVHKTISEKERNYIMGQNDIKVQIKRPVPWKPILTSIPVWASFATHVGSGVAFVFFLTQVPSYIHYIHGINVKSSGMLSSIPYLASFFTSVAFGLISDYLTNKKIINVRNARRISNSISQIGVAMGLICASFATSTTVAVICLVVTMGCHMGIHTGWMLNHIDLSPIYSGILMALGNMLLHIFVLVLPIFVSNVVVDVRNPSQWRTLMFSMAGLSFITNIIFVLFLSVDVQPWNERKIDDTENEDINRTSTRE